MAHAFSVSVWILLLSVSNIAFAHHGRDFLLVQSAHIPESGDAYVIARQDYLDRGDGRETELEPGAVAGVTDWLTMELHGHAAKEEGEPMRYESTGAVAYVRWTPREARWSIGTSVEYVDAADNELHDEVAAAMLTTYEASDWIFAMNLDATHERDSSEDDSWGIRGAVRRSFKRSVAFGVEFVGSFDHREDREVMFGAYLHPMHPLTINLGVGTGFDGGPDYTLRSALIWQISTGD